MGKGRKSFHKEYEPPEEQFVVVVDAWGQSEDRKVYTNNVGAWFEIMLRRVYPREKPQIVQGLVPEYEVVKDIRPFLGVHPYATFLTTPGAVGSDKVVTIYEYNFRRFDHPERRNWKESCPCYREIHPKFPVRDPYPLPGDIGLHLLIPVPHPPLNAPYAIPVPAPAILANLGPPPIPQSNCGEETKSNTPVGHARQHSPPRIAGPSRNIEPSADRGAHPPPPPRPVPLTPHRTPQPTEPSHAPKEHQRTPTPTPHSSQVPSQSDSSVYSIHPIQPSPRPFHPHGCPAPSLRSRTPGIHSLVRLNAGGCFHLRPKRRSI
ncbi:hypothetical protein FA13DRAFT_713863 [Coprinellus micaceus]|uniref:Uncharacterized protein n=1 Tax=Coprinellus micaceus TaxID=71717 RepID=A0A4Y7TWF6_COPMI|nr:hypothetical protein FA13DRAFT_713863 [Coprinellus micaceus]